MTDRDFDPWAAARGMVEDQIAARGVNDPAVLAAMRSVPRHLFVPEGDGRRRTTTARWRSGTARRSRSPTSSR